MKKILIALFLMLGVSGTFDLQAYTLNSSYNDYSHVVYTWDTSVTYHPSGLLILEAHYTNAEIWLDLNHGCQVMQIFDLTLDANCEFYTVGDYIVHLYGWGEVWTGTGYQEIRFY